MKLLIVVVILGLAGCATPQQRAYSPNLAQCQYEAEVATAHSDYVVSVIREQDRLIDLCLRAKGAAK